MIKVNILRNSENRINSFTVEGHAGFTKSGNDIVCAAVTALVFSTVNSIDEFTGVEPELRMSDDGGYLELTLNEPDHDADLLVESLVFGLKGISKDYKRYLRVIDS